MGIYQKLFLMLIIFSATIINAKINTIVSVVPQKIFLEKIGGDKVNITLMVKPGSSPHSYEPKPSQMRDITKANIYYTIGVEFEKVWLKRFLNQNPNIKIVDMGKNIARSNNDPHIWTSVDNVKQISKNIYNSLVKYDPKNRQYYKQNLDKFLQELNSLDKTIKTILSKIPKNSKFMVFHPAWGYFAKEYSLVQLPIEIDGKNPKPRQIAKLIKEARENRVKAIFTAPEFSTKVAKQIANELNIKVVQISPLAKNWAKNLIYLANNIAK